MKVRALAPAKLNLGLEILGRRSDGYHEVRTLYCAISLFDRIKIGKELVSGSAFGERDLATRARDAFLETAKEREHVGISIRKRIPVAAGMGGGSSDAAAVLLGMNQRRPGVDLIPIARNLGSDVPFLLSAGLALGSGRGEELEPLPFRAMWFIVLTPIQAMPDKTRMMFASLLVNDFSDGSTVLDSATRLRQDAELPIAFHNGFARALYHQFPDVARMANGVEQLVGLPVNVTGAGPSLFVSTESLEQALNIRTAIWNQYGVSSGMRLFCARSISHVPLTLDPDE